MSQDTQVLSMLQTGLCLPSLSRRVFELDKIPGWPIAGLDDTLGMVPCAALQPPVQRSHQHGQQTAHCTQHGQIGPCSPPAYSPWGAAGLQLQEEPVSGHGSMVFKDLSDRLGAFGCREGKGRARWALLHPTPHPNVISIGLLTQGRVVRASFGFSWVADGPEQS